MKWKMYGAYGRRDNPYENSTLHFFIHFLAALRQLNTDRLLEAKTLLSKLPAEKREPQFAFALAVYFHKSH